MNKTNIGYKNRKNVYSITQTLISNEKKQNRIHTLKYRRSTTSGCKDKWNKVE